ncbi:hypothetical protein TNCT_398411 [Trichonephila clavata]|uniref:Uncharacterized protein n=1 Tax=Trichonephila clavata TaxID=2740835 RepID=A0A8X6L3I9_TRICU|nr:hypothetical protein TNCT_398411 [Trichonephila clavata]
MILMPLLLWRQISPMIIQTLLLPPLKFLTKKLVQSLSEYSKENRLAVDPRKLWSNKQQNMDAETGSCDENMSESFYELKRSKTFDNPKE